MRIEALPPAHEIEHPEIRQAAEKYDVVQQQLKGRQSQIKHLERDRETAEWLDAQAAEEAAEAGKPAPKRHHLSDHLKKADDLAHELKVAELATKRARGDLRAVLDQYGAEWTESLAIRAEDLEQKWDEAVAGLIKLYGERTALQARRVKLGGEAADIARIRLKPAQLIDSLNGEKLQLAHYPDGGARQRRRAVVNTGDVLAALAEVGKPYDEPQAFAASGFGEAVRASFAHTKTMDRGYAPGEENAPAVNERQLFVNGRVASVYVPDAGSDR